MVPKQNKNDKSTSKILKKVKNDSQMELERKFSNLETRNNKLRSDEIVNNNVLEEQRANSIKKIFEMMQKMGVDPTNIEELSSFLATFEETNPDMFVIFEEAMNNLLSKESPNVNIQAPVPEGQGLMDKFSNLGKSMMMPR